MSVLTAYSYAGVSPIGVSIVPPIQFPPEDFAVAGVRVNLIYGQHQKVYGFDFGAIGNITTQTMDGLQAVGGFNYNKGESNIIGAQVAGIGNWNINKSNVIGVQIAGLINSNRAESFVLGVIGSVVNLTEHTKVVGIEAGLYNKAHEVYGFQIGLVNMVESLHGLQLGLINFHTHGVFSVSPFINFGF